MNEYILHQLTKTCVPVIHPRSDAIESALPRMYDTLTWIDSSISEIEIPENMDRQRMYDILLLKLESTGVYDSFCDLEQDRYAYHFSKDLDRDTFIYESPICQGQWVDIAPLLSISKDSPEYEILFRCVCLLSAYSFNLFDYLEWVKDVAECLDEEDQNVGGALLKEIESLSPFYDDYTNYMCDINKQVLLLTCLLDSHPVLPSILVQYVKRTIEAVEGLDVCSPLFEQSELPFTMYTGFGTCEGMDNLNQELDSHGQSLSDGGLLPEVFSLERNTLPHVRKMNKAIKAFMDTIFDFSDVANEVK